MEASYEHKQKPPAFKGRGFLLLTLWKVIAALQRCSFCLSPRRMTGSGGLPLAILETPEAFHRMPSEDGMTILNDIEKGV